MTGHELPAELEQRLEELVRAHGLADHWGRIRAAARPAYTIELDPAGDAAVGASRFGGVPDLPPGVTWPSHEGQFLTFIAQLNLADLPGGPATPLPRRGLLYFFLGVDEPAYNIHHQILYADAAANTLLRQEPPAGDRFLNDECAVFPPAAVRFVPTASVPTFWDDPAMDDLFDRVENLREELENPSGAREHSQLLGYPVGVSGEPLVDAYVCTRGHPDILFDLNQPPEGLDQHIAEAEREGDTARAEWLRKKRESLAWWHGNLAHHESELDHWQLLLEVDSHDDCGMLWWDAGTLQFIVDTRDLERLDFSRTYACVQTS